MKKKIIFIITLVIFIFFIVLFSQTKSTSQYVSMSSNQDVYIHDKYIEVDLEGNSSYYINVSYSVLGKTYNHILRLNDEFEVLSKELLYDSLFVDKEYAAIGFVINIPMDVAKEENILEFALNGRGANIDISRFFSKEDAFIEQWLEINYIQAELY